MEEHKTYTAFDGFNRIGTGDLGTMLAETWKHLTENGNARVIIYDDCTGRQVDFDFSGGLDAVLERALPKAEPKGPGRPKLGVVSREISLLPRHWEWLERQPVSASAVIRRLVDAARRSEDRSRERIEAAGNFMWSIAGNLEGFEEASRALYAGKWDDLDVRTANWPVDVREHLNGMLGPVRG